MNKRQAAVAIRRFEASGVQVLGTDEKGNPRFNGPSRVAIVNPATRRRLYYQDYGWALSAAEWHRGVCRRLCAG